MADPSRKPPRAPMDLYLDRMIDEALRDARDGGGGRLQLVTAERESRPLLPLPGWSEVAARDGAGSPKLSAVTDRFRRMIEAYVSRQAGNA